MKEINLYEVKIGDIIRYQYYMSCRNSYVTVTKITNKYIVTYNDILREEIRFKKETGRGVGYFAGYYIDGINDSKDYVVQDMQDACYY